MLTTNLPIPSQDVVAEVYFFHELSDADKRRILPTLTPFFRDPDNTPIDDLPDDLRRWLKAIRALNEQKQRSVAVWLSRYCVNSEKALAEIGPAPQDVSPLAPATRSMAIPVEPEPEEEIAEDPAYAFLKPYSFISNPILLTTDLPMPPSEVMEAVIFFHQLPEADKQQLLPRLKTFFDRPDTTGLLLDLPEHLVEWLEELVKLNENKFRGVAVWLSRYCAYPTKTLQSFGPLGIPEEPIQSKKVPTGVLSDDQSVNISQWVGAGRAKVVGMPLKVASVAGNLALASGISLSLLVGMVFVLMLVISAIIADGFSPLWLLLSIGVTILVNVALFLVAPWIMDLTQRWLYGTRWVSLATIQQHSPETVEVLKRITQKHKIPMPKLGLINDQNPTAFTYGSFPGSARVVVSQGLFTYLSDEEIATVYAHEMGHVVHWDFAIMTLANTLIQITYLIYTYINDHVKGNDKTSKAIRNAALVAYLFYVVGTYIVLYLSRVREYFADHFAAEVTGNPNALSRALVKIAYGIMAAEEEERNQKTGRTSHLLEGTRALGIYDGRAATGTATAYRLANEGKQVGLVFLWDLFNPWAWWMELNSTHPLTGKRVRALSTYAEQLGLPSEFDMGRVVAEGRKLDRKRLYGSFVVDVVIMNAPWIGGLLGVLLGSTSFLMGSSRAATILMGSILLCGCLGYLLLTAIQFPKFSQAQPTSILKAMVNPYASPLRGIPLEIEGQVIGRGDAGYTFGSDLKFQDATGMIFLRYASRFGPLGNFLFGANKVKQTIGKRGQVQGWFRRGVAPWVDLSRIETVSGEVISSYPAFWGYVGSLLGIVVGIILLVI